jgi:hypothetical protein
MSAYLVYLCQSVNDRDELDVPPLYMLGRYVNGNPC